MVLVVRREEVEECLRREPGYEGALAVLETSFRELGLHNRVVSYREQRPEVAEEQVRRPLVILGLPRTGTTVASCLLDQDTGQYICPQQ